jgi:23S rRNA (guanine745-N1)-methyltransferase
MACADGHSFDVAREGYVNLVGPGRPPRVSGDSKAMVTRRLAFLEAGHYRPAASRIARHAAAHLERLERSRPPVILDAGCGPGWYLSEVVDRLGGRTVRAVGTDVSKEAIRSAARRHPEHCFLIADTNVLLPLPDRSVSVLIDVFAPRNRAEFRRVLADDGLLIVAIPTPRHLRELPGGVRPLDVQPDKRPATLRALGPTFELELADQVTIALALSPEEVADLVLMGPGAHHLPSERIQVETPLQLTADIELLLLRPC